MTSTLAQVKKLIVPILQSEGVIRSDIFGSYARNEQTNDSDLDLLIEFPKGKSLLDLVRLERKLQQALDKPVDVVTYNSISKYLKKYIESDMISIL